MTSTTFTVERGRVRMFARAIGERGTVHDDLDVARAAGHPDLLVPPTFFFTAEIEEPDAFAFVAAHGVGPDETILHGEQRFEYHAPVHAGDVLEVVPGEGVSTVKKGGAMLLVERSTRYLRDGQEVARSTTVLVVPREGVTA
jgi:hypothetical protein